MCLSWSVQIYYISKNILCYVFCCQFSRHQFLQVHHQVQMKPADKEKKGGAYGKHLLDI